ncbi:MAG: DUF1156 domain-containing protein [Rhodospirillales bacterium]|nr:DUF1156 domain-containing protein [Rhodospirillales bacterium]
MEPPYKKKLIEVALPLEAINAASAKEKSIRHGHPSTLHLWWARRPLAACRAVLFAQLVDDPSERVDELLADPETRRKAEARLREQRKEWALRREKADEAGMAGGRAAEIEPEPTLENAAAMVERERLFAIIEDLVKWENTTNETVLERARAEIRRSCGDNPPPVYDPFCGGGSIPLEAQRLGLEAHASDLNPVAVLITKALVEIPPKFAGLPPVNPGSRAKLERGAWNGKGAQGLAEDVRYYGQWMRDEAYRRIGHLYPQATLPDGAQEAGSAGGATGTEEKKATVIAWLWARTVVCPNPACRADLPLVSSYALSTKKGKQAWVEPAIDRSASPPRVRFAVKTGVGTPPEPTKLGRGANFRCPCCGTIAPDTHVKAEGRAGRMGAQLMAVVSEGNRSRIYLPPSEEMERAARMAQPIWRPEQEMPKNPRWFSPPDYGMMTYGDLFTPRQLVALTTFSDLVGEAREKVVADAEAAGLPSGQPRLAAGGAGAEAYADAVAKYLAFAVDRASDAWSTIASWASTGEFIRNTFSRQAIPMVWDYTECNPFSNTTGNFGAQIEWISKCFDGIGVGKTPTVEMADATGKIKESYEFVVSTDPPYYDNIGYADLSDYFYVWLRRSLMGIYPDLFATMLVPKAEELVATPYRHGSKNKAEAFFMEGMGKALRNMAAAAHPDYPVTLYYAFKQAEVEREGVASTGWATFLEALTHAGFSVDGTWPMRTERSARSVGIGANALASSIVLVCRKRAATAPVITRAEFIKAMRAELPAAIKLLQHGHIAAVDLAQASIGPGMAIFTRYARVLEADDSPMTVKTALQLINQALDEYLSEQEAEYDAHTRFAITWFETHGMDAGPYGAAETLATARGVAVDGVRASGILEARSGRVRLLARSELPGDWDPLADTRLTVWECTQHLIQRLEGEGESAAAALLARLGVRGELARDLATRLYRVCERRKRADEARAYNGLVVAWPELTRLAAQARTAPAQAELAV